ncbi:photosynthetic reaction center cytochrome PufC [Ideonella sp. DXS29W]|uniref:Photosynthetic reaction center cytochrome c subunit n=1 Tax=Ideonella lacteola TaxID=2984193 RepID=A0ABU9BN53_9BURK
MTAPRHRAALGRVGGLAAIALAALSGCERPPMDTVQLGYRGTGMTEVYNPRLLALQEGLNAVPEDQPPASPDGPRAKEVFQNVKVLGDQSVGEFTRTMLSMTAWVAPKEGCAYCHNTANLADDSLYTKVVARRMLEMTRHINASWKVHVASTGVTCYTCHRGNPVPTQTWFAPLQNTNHFIGNKAGQNSPATSVGLAALPNDPFSAYLSGSTEIRVEGVTALPSGRGASMQQTEATFGLMTHMSRSLGVNCTFCHNTRQFSGWEESSPQRITAWHGIRMARDVNGNYLDPLAATFPAQRKGPVGDVAKVSCATCHQGAYKPLYGKSMLAGHPELIAPAAKASSGPIPADALAATAAVVSQETKSP